MRQSRRLAVQKMKEEDERKQIEEAMYRSLEDESKKVSCGTNLYYELTKNSEVPEEKKENTFFVRFQFSDNFRKVPTTDFQYTGPRLETSRFCHTNL